MISRFLFIFTVGFFFQLFWPATTYAHGAGMPPYVKINNVYSNSNPLSLITASSVLTNYAVPLDTAPENYIVNQELQFTLDNTALLAFVPQNMLDQTKFTWDFGDGKKSFDKNTKHTYTKKGSYIIHLTLSIPEENTTARTQYTDSILLNILSDKNEQMPQAVIKVNNTVIKNPKTNTITMNFSDQATFDGSRSLQANGKIIEYLWDFGDGTTSNQESVTHTYRNQYVETPVLRIKDSDGFLAYNFAIMTNQETLYRSKEEARKSDNSRSLYLLSGIVFIVVAMGLLSLQFFLSHARMVKKNK